MALQRGTRCLTTPSERTGRAHALLARLVGPAARIPVGEGCTATCAMSPARSGRLQPGHHELYYFSHTLGVAARRWGWVRDAKDSTPCMRCAALPTAPRYRRCTTSKRESRQPT